MAAGQDGGAGTADPAFTSTLSAQEYALLSGLGIRPLGQVLGASVHQVGSQILPADARWGASDYAFPLRQLEDAWAAARRHAIERLSERATHLGADEVVGMSLRRSAFAGTARMIELLISGTAVTIPGTDPPPGGPRLSNLPVQDWWKLRQAGWAAAGLVATTAVMFVSQGQSTRRRRRLSMTTNQELFEYSDGFQAARRMAVTQLRDQARRLGAAGILAASFDYAMTERDLQVETRGRGASGLSLTSLGAGVDASIGFADSRKGIVFTIHAEGTAIVPAAAAAPPAAIGITIDLGRARCLGDAPRI